MTSIPKVKKIKEKKVSGCSINHDSIRESLQEKEFYLYFEKEFLIYWMRGQTFNINNDSIPISSL